MLRRRGRRVQKHKRTQDRCAGLLGVLPKRHPGLHIRPVADPTSLLGRWATRERKLFQRRMSFERHSSLTDFTQRSANEFKSGLRAGSLTGATPIASMVRWNDLQNFESRS